MRLTTIALSSGIALLLLLLPASAQSTTLHHYYHQRFRYTNRYHVYTHRARPLSDQPIQAGLPGVSLEDNTNTCRVI